MTNTVQLLATTLVVSALAGEAVAAGAAAEPFRVVALPALEHRLRTPALPALPLVPNWCHWLQLMGPHGQESWRREPGAAPVRRLQLRWVYARLLELPELDRVGRFAHVSFPMPGVSGGPELLRLAPQPPRDDYPRTRVIAPGWSWWYVSSERWAVGIATGTRFLLSEQSRTIVDPFTSEARWAFFLP